MWSAQRCCPAVGADIDATGLAVQALIATGEPANSTVILNALDFLNEHQQGDAGWDTFGGSIGNTNSTAWAIQGVMAALQDPQEANWNKGNQSAWDMLLRVQHPSGYFEYSDPPPIWATDLVLNTLQAMPSVAGKPFPYLDEMWIGTARVEINVLNGDFYATALYGQDLNTNSTSQMRYRSVGGAWSEWRAMTRVNTKADAAFVRTVSGLEPGKYEFEFQFGDTDGTMQGTTYQTVKASWLIQYLPMIFKDLAP